MFKRILIAALLAAALLPATSQALTPVRYAKFTAKITGAQTTKWSFTGRTTGDCKGTVQAKGEGTEVFRFDSGRAEKVLVQVNPTGSVHWKFGTWSPLDFDNPLGLISDIKSTRHGRQWGEWIAGGWCGRPAPTVPPNDCGTRRGVGSTILSSLGSRLTVQVIPSGFFKPFKDCSVTMGEGASGNFTRTAGRLSKRLLLSKKGRIVVEDGDVYRRDDGALGTDAITTTHFRLVLTRKGAR